MADQTGQFYASEGFHGYGTQLLMGNGASPETFQAVAYVRSIQPGDMTTAVADRTHLRSPRAHREKLAALRDSGPFTCELIWAPQDESQSNAGGGSGSFTTGGLLKAAADRSEHNWIIRLPDAPLGPGLDWPFRGVVTRFQPGNIDVEGTTAVGATTEITPLTDPTEDLP